MLSAKEKVSDFLFLGLANFLGMVVLSQIETTIRHEFMEIHKTKVEFRDLIQEQAHWEILVSSSFIFIIPFDLRDFHYTTNSSGESVARK